MTKAPRVAFYAPMKSPNHPNPSGDRQIARQLIKTLELAGASVEVASELRTYDGAGDSQVQVQTRERGLAEGAALIKRYEADPHTAPTHWFTYHLYHKAPDWTGPVVSQTLGIPYIVAEASFAPKQAQGRWRLGHEQVRAALGRAAAAIVLNPVDLACVAPLLGDDCVIEKIPMWTDQKPDPGDRPTVRQKIAQDFGLNQTQPWLIAVAMMRTGDKTSSFLRLSESLEQVTSSGWQLLVVGDGEARAQVQEMFSNFADRTAFLGARDPDEVSALLRASDLMVWPAVNEAIGMALLEAQANGVPVVAGNEGGVHTVVDSGQTGLLTHPDDSQAFAAAVSRLLNDDALRSRFGASARKRVSSRHSNESAASNLRQLLRRLIADE